MIPATGGQHRGFVRTTEFSFLEDGQNNFPKHAELTEAVIVASICLSVLFISMMHGQANIR